jgi:hypothetical protein
MFRYFLDKSECNKEIISSINCDLKNIERKAAIARTLIKCWENILTSVFVMCNIDLSYSMIVTATYRT